MDSDKVNVFVRQEENSTTNRENDELTRIAENFDPLNFEKEPYEDIEVETSFRHEDSRQTAV